MGHRQVFPTLVGVFPSAYLTLSTSSCLPHARGGVSTEPDTSALEAESSPRSWGCFRQDDDGRAWVQVFPTLVGVFPPHRSRRRLKPCLPHARGGVSDKALSVCHPNESSPRSWGCFLDGVDEVGHDRVFPTLVGVFLGLVHDGVPATGLPHARGGVSDSPHFLGTCRMSSPRSWGCFYFPYRCGG